MEPYLPAIVGALFTLLMSLVAFFGTKMFTKIDDLPEKFGDKLGESEQRLHTRISEQQRIVIDHGNRIGKLETRCDIMHSDAFDHQQRAA